MQFIASCKTEGDNGTKSDFVIQIFIQRWQTLPQEKGKECEDDDVAGFSENMIQKIMLNKFE